MLLVVWILSLCSLYVSALFEDQVGKFDWRQLYLGKVKAASFEHSGGNLRIIVATNQHVLASINPRTGSIAWRQILEKRMTMDALQSGEEVITVSGGGEATKVRSWDPVNGYLNWEVNIPQVLNGEVTRYFQQDDSKITMTLISVVSKSHVDITCFQYGTGVIATSSRIPAPWIETSSCAFVDSSHFVCVDGSSAILHELHLVGGSKAFIPHSLSAFGITAAGTNPSITTWPELKSKFKMFVVGNALLQLSDKGLTLLKHIPQLQAAHLTEVDGEPLLFFLTLLEGNIVLQTLNARTGSLLDDVHDELNIPRSHGQVEKMLVYAVVKKDGGVGYRVLITTESESLLLLQHPGKVVWAREEALANILSVEMVDLPLSESEALFEKEIGSGGGNLLTMLMRRIVTQILRLQSYVVNLVDSSKNSSIGEIGSEEPRKLSRDHFNLHKMIVVATAAGKLFGIDSQTGIIAWRHLVPNLVPFSRFGQSRMPFYTQRTTAHYPHLAQCVVLGRNKVTSEDMLYVFDPMTGQPVNEGGANVIHLEYKVAQAILLPHVDHNFLRGILLLDSQQHVHVFPSSSLQTALEHGPSTYIFTADPASGEMHGYSLKASTDQLIAIHAWSIRIPTSLQIITNVIPKRSNERVHSQGRVMGDRSVLYKYMNPNLVVVTTEGNDVTQKGSLYVHLIDAVTGHFVFSATHKRSKGPVHVVHSENWVVYTYQNEKARRGEVAVLELYEGKSQSNSTVFSSLHTPSPPLVERQAYVFPSAIDAMADTITEKGITNKHLIFVLPTGGIVELPKALLDPRRPLIPTQEHREEGIVPYIPELPIPTENFVNYNQSVFRIHKVTTSPTSLESTCLVLAYGLDLFFTRVTPSKTFDVLKDDFDHVLISAVLLALLLGSYITKRLAARKILRQAWK